MKPCTHPPTLRVSLRLTAEHAWWVWCSRCGAVRKELTRGGPFGWDVPRREAKHVRKESE